MGILGKKEKDPDGLMVKVEVMPATLDLLTIACGT